jgi:preprotein translocase subunit SecE
MAMNRETKRMLQRQGAVAADGTPTRQRRQPVQPRPQEKEKRTSPAQFLREVRGELRKVAWPTRSEVVNYSIIVLVAVVILTSLIAALDWVFSEFVLKLFNE